MHSIVRQFIFMVMERVAERAVAPRNNETSYPLRKFVGIGALGLLALMFLLIALSAIVSAIGSYLQELGYTPVESALFCALGSFILTLVFVGIAVLISKEYRPKPQETTIIPNLHLRGLANAFLSGWSRGSKPVYKSKDNYKI